MPTTRGDPSAAAPSSARSSSATPQISRWLLRPQVTTYLTTVLPSSCRPSRPAGRRCLAGGIGGPKPSAYEWSAADASEDESFAGVGNGVGVGSPTSGVHHAGANKGQSGEQPRDLG